MDYLGTINIQYLAPLLGLWIFLGWLFMLERDNESSFYSSHHVALMDSCFWKMLKGISVLAILVSLVLNCVFVNIISTLCIVGILIVAQLINSNILYYIHRAIFGTEQFAILIPLVLVIILDVYLFIAQFILPAIFINIH